MAKAYSYDFRQKVIESIELDGFKKQDASEMFNISRTTINLWFPQKAAIGEAAQWDYCSTGILAGVVVETTPAT